VQGGCFASERHDRAAYFRRNQDIHAGIVAAAGNRSLIEVHGLLNRQLYKYRYQGSVNEAVWDTAIAEHETIMSLINARDGESLDRFLQKHVRSTWEKIAPTNA
jgi:DNA-binding GntR family transcriptional regulator